jgi:outer membrane protein assembly factor BamB
MMIRVLSALSLFATVAAFSAPADDAKSILAATNTHGGIVVQLGIGDGKLTAALKQNDGTLVHGLDKDGAKVDAVREWMRKDGIYGQVAVEKLTSSVLPYLDGMINLIVVNDQLGLADDELMRVLAPNGSIFKDGKKTVKPKDVRMDDWTHYLHSANGNPVSQDTAVGPPENLQWVGSPRWSRHHDRMSSISGMVSNNGRIFYIMDMGSRISIMLPPKWQLIARDGYNGMILWTKEIPDWQNHMWPLKSGPTQLTRRLVAMDDKIYVTLGRATHVTCLSAFDGSVIKEYPDTKFCEEILVDGGQMLVQARHTDDDERTTFTPSQGDQGRSNNGYFWDEKPRGIMLVDLASGKTLWNKDQVVAPLSLCMDDKHVVFHDGVKVECWDRATGAKQWESDKAARKMQISANFGPRVLIYKTVVLFAGGEGHMTSYDLATGKQLWQDEHPPSGYQSPQDLMVARGLVWCAGTTSGNLDGNFKGRDAVTGEVKFEIPPDVAKDTYWFHHRCYISKATENFIMPSRTGVEFVDLDKKTWDINHWVRGACLYGVMPANGLVYAPPHDCACYPETKLYGINAMAPKIAARPKPTLNDGDEGRFEKGPAYDDKFVDAKDPTNDDWPTYRGSPGRTGFLRADVGSNLGEGWTTKLGGKLSAISVGEGKVFVAQVEQHTLHALNQKTGTPEWHFTTGGRIDSPPSVWKGRVVFGCMDGWVYCLRAKDGALVWRFRGAPKADRHMAFEGLESVWPVSGAVLMEGNVAQFIAGRSNFMDGGLRFVKVDVESGSKLVETSVDDKDPLTGGDFQDSHQTLQMPAGLADILVSDGKYTYMKSQRFNADGTRSEFGVNSGNAIGHGADQQGEGAHVYAPMGFMDDSWFHRSYWVYGKNMAGGHNGYYQAGKFTPAGRILCVDDKNVYSYARKPQYYKWTTPLEHHLFSAPKEAPKVEPSQLAAALEGGNPRKAKKQDAKKGKAGAKAAPEKTDSVLTVAHTDKLDPSNKEFTLEAWFRGELTSGVLAVQGGNAQGYGIALDQGKPKFAIAINNKTSFVISPVGIDDTWHHVAGVLAKGGKMKLYVDGQLAAESSCETLMPKNPNLGFSIGDNNASKLFPNLPSFTGWIDMVRLSYTALRPEDAKSLGTDPDTVPPAAANTVLAIGFDKQDGTDTSPAKQETKIAPKLTFDLGAKGGYAVHISSDDAKTGPGAVAATNNAVKGPPNGYFVEPHWAHEIPIIARGMALANNVLFIGGPDDIVDEEDALNRMTKGDTSVEPSLKQQDELLDGKHGAVVLAVDAVSGEVKSTTKLTSPPQWDGMAAAKGAVFVSQLDGSVVCLKGK